MFSLKTGANVSNGLGKMKFLKQKTEKKLKSLSNLVYSLGKERFGDLKRKPTRTPARPNRRQRHITEIRKELKSLRKSYHKANAESTSSEEDKENSCDGMLSRSTSSIRNPHRHG
ncbi:hypothetical protein DPMN_092495 [Dreissena polymorpha]|uniref:Uncharacterized protein n=1 Tax=Dreissena polymorpha TaxID=45954 RepID=A0A9D4L2G9_DREPO|nr:hypothetical protein DPMN_092495 [Dreissena polymorpha]